jgi:hypothetical protein
MVIGKGTLLLFIVFTLLGYVIGKKLSPALLNLQNKIRRVAKIKKYRIHHDLGGLLLIALSIILTPPWLQGIVAGLGLGLLIHHITTEGIELITKD